MANLSEVNDAALLRTIRAINSKYGAGDVITGWLPVNGQGSVLVRRPSCWDECVRYSLRQDLCGYKVRFRGHVRRVR